MESSAQPEVHGAVDVEVEVDVDVEVEVEVDVDVDDAVESLRSRPVQLSACARAPAGARTSRSQVPLTRTSSTVAWTPRFVSVL